MKHYLIAERYARGLDRALEQGADREAVLASLRTISDHYLSSLDLRNVLSNPAISADERAGLLREILRREDAPPFVVSLLESLLRRGRITVLPAVAELFAAMTDERMNRAGAVVTTATSLTEDQQNKLRAALEAYSGTKVRADFRVNPDLLGGVIARIKGKVIDGSLRARIERLKQSLLPEENLGG